MTNSMYCSTQDVRAVLSPDANADDDTSAANFADDQINFEIEYASAIVDGYLLRHYAIPFTYGGQPASTPPLIKHTVAVLAAYACTMTKAGSDDQTDNDPMIRRVKQAQQTLTGIQMNNILLPLDLASAQQAQEDIKLYNKYDGTLFWPGDTALRAVIPDQDFDVSGWYQGRGPYNGAW